MPLQQTSGNVTADAFGGGVAAVPNYIEDVFSTYLYTGNGATQTINNGIDLAGKGGLVWAKSRSSVAQHVLADTVRGTGQILQTSTTNGNTATALNITSFNADGYGLSSYSGSNGSGITYASWTFRKQPKFFDVVTWTGNGANRTIAHNLGSVPGTIIVKRTDTTGAWQVYHRSLANTEYMVLNTTAAVATGATRWNSTTPTSTVFSLGTDATVNASGGTYIAYIFAHDAGGFGLTGTDNVVSCGSFTTDGSGNATVNLGCEPQWVMIKSSSAVDGWIMLDVMRGWSMAANDRYLSANTSSAESVLTGGNPTATGFVSPTLAGGQNYIYIAVRRGPMKVPTDGTKVYSNRVRTGDAAITQVTGLGFAPDLVMSFNRDGTFGKALFDKLRGQSNVIVTSSTAAEVTTASDSINSFNMDGITIGVDSNGYSNFDPYPYVYEYLRRAPGFFDEVCYTGTGVARTVAHNLTVVPELIIVKSRSLSASDWRVNLYNILGSTTGAILQSSDAAFNDTSAWNSFYPTATQFGVGTPSDVNASGQTYVAYLFATCPGVSKVGSYTGNGTTQTIACGFAAGARFVLIKRTDSTGGWYVYDTARGMTTLTDPYLFLNSTAAEVATLGSVTTVATGFALNSAILAAINVSGGTYIFLAIA